MAFFREIVSKEDTEIYVVVFDYRRGFSYNITKHSVSAVTGITSDGRGRELVFSIKDPDMRKYCIEGTDYLVSTKNTIRTGAERTHDVFIYRENHTKEMMDVVTEHFERHRTYVANLNRQLEHLNSQHILDKLAYG